MPVYYLTDSKEMPSPEKASAEGLVAVGGDLSAEMLVNAYSKGLFPWFSEDSEILWWSPDPRMVLFVDDLKVHKSMRTLLRKETFSITYNLDFESVIKACKEVKRKNQNETWITSNMLKAYLSLHKSGLAHSVEVWKDHQLVGGLYYVRIGKMVFGESMFSSLDNASKIGFIHWVNRLKMEGVSVIDCQVYTGHLASLGAVEIPRADFLKIVRLEISHK
jgi:leucyl/phenylalanyl-tRNA--protein transferase